MRDERSIIRRLRRELAVLDLDGPTSMADLCARFGQRRGRPIKLLPFSLDVPGPFGMWIGARNFDYIVYQAETTAVHQQHIIAHEFGHMFAGHRTDGNNDDIWQQLMPDISAETIRKFLRRTNYETAQEREAETVATVLLERAAVAELVAEPARSPDARRMQRFLEGSRGWL
ncbi:hypothetical protein ACFXPA_05610 [Amycolatopsis sp. NPDC059090]|uniref:hypothetical protein n=1 Tax=unclassified Amycolatopsis TaxID=2618356 RepID=UPI00366F84AA